MTTITKIEYTQKLNQLDNQLKDYFDVVKIVEKVDKSNFYFEFLVEKEINHKNVEVKFFIPMKDFANSTLHWSYLSNPKDSNSYLVERVSAIENIANDVKEIVDKNKLDSIYLENLKSNIKTESLFEKLIHGQKSQVIELMEKFDVQHLETHQLFEDNVETHLSYFKHNLKPSDKSRVEIALSAAGYDKVMWLDNKILVKYYV